MSTSRPEFIDSAARSFEQVQTLTLRTAKAPQLGQLLRSLGLGVVKETSPDGKPQLAVECVGLNLKIVPAAEPSDPRETTLHFAVASLDEAVRAATERQAPVLKPAHDSSWGRRAIVADPDGRRIILTERLKERNAPPVASPEATAPPSTGITIALPGELPAQPRLIDATPKRATKPGEAATPADLLPAIGAAKRAIVLMLVGSLALGVLIAAEASQAIERNDVHRLNDLNLGAPAIGSLIGLVVLLLFIFPRSPRLRYGGLWTAMGISASIVAIVSLHDLDIGDRDRVGTFAGVASLIGLASPLLIYQYLAQLAKKAEAPALIRLVSLNIKLYLAMVGLLLAMIAAMIAFPPLAAVLIFIFLIVQLAQFIGFVCLVMRVVRFQPVRPKTTEKVAAPTPLGLGDHSR